MDVTEMPDAPVAGEDMDASASSRKRSRSAEEMRKEGRGTSSGSVEDDEVVLLESFKKPKVARSLIDVD